MLRFFASSIGNKIIMALTGIIFIGFLMGHLLGNLQIFEGREAVNAYAALLKSMPKLLWTVRIGLILSLVLHVWTSIRLTLHNRAARPVAYAQNHPVSATLSSRTMMLSGLVVLAFVLYHLAHFTFTITHPEFADFHDSTGRHDVYGMMVLGFQSTYVSAFYVLAQILLCMHLSHGFSSAPQTLGMMNGTWAACVRRSGRALAVLIAAAYISIPLSVWLGIVTYASTN